MRLLVCIDPVPAADGSCAQTAFIEQPTFVDYLPTVDQAQAVGFAFFASIAVLASMGLFKPSRSDADE
jgi:hypothetical protein